MLMRVRKQNKIQDKSVYFTIFIGVILLGVLVAYNFDDLSVLAAKGGPGKSTAVQDISNGYPSGPHFNLNIHGRDVPWNGCEEVSFPEELGKNINTPLRSIDPDTGVTWDPIPQIEFITNNKRSDVTTLSVLDNCTQHVHPSDKDAARILLPKNPAEGEYPGGYYVYSRILAKPNHGDTIEPSNAIFYPNLDLLTVCNDKDVTDDPDLFADLTDCEDLMLVLGQVTNKGEVFDAGGDPLVRFDEDQKNPKGKQTGKSKATDITGMFYWKGAFCSDEFDTDGDNLLELSDFDVFPDDGNGTIGPEDGDGIVDADDLQRLMDAGILLTDLADGAALLAAVDLVTVNGMVDETEFLALLALINNCEVFDDYVWIFDIADIVIHGFDYVNDGAKLVQIRFYDANAVNVQYGGDAPIP